MEVIEMQGKAKNSLQIMMINISTVTEGIK